MKDIKKQIRVDELTDQFVDALVKHMSTPSKKSTQSDVYRTGVYELAKAKLPVEVFESILLNKFK